MGRPLEVSDGRSNSAETIEYAAQAIGQSEIRQAIFGEVYRHTAAWKSASAVAAKIGRPRSQLIKDVRPLVLKNIILQEKRSDDIYYGMDSFLKAHKSEVLKFAKNPKKLAELPTKRRPAGSTVRRGSVLLQRVLVPTRTFDVQRITVDDIDAFSAIKDIKPGSNLTGMSEDVFKKGVQAIIGEGGEFKDWGGEKSDLFSTRLALGGRRLAAAFAFKGPGQPGKLTIRRMGKNGDQGPRLFQEPAEIFIVQHWREIDPQVIDLMQSLAIARSVTLGKPIWYGIVDGQDSDRLVRAYPKHFGR